MNLPNYFLADLPPEATLTAAMVGEASQTLRRNRAHYLAHRSTESLVHLLSGVAKGWLEPENPFRKLALEGAVARTGFSQATLASGLDAFFRQVTVANVRALLAQEFGDGECVASVEGRGAKVESSGLHSTGGARPLPQVCHFWRGPDLIAHIAAGNIPSPALLSIVQGLLVRSAQFVKCASGTSWLPRLFAHSIYEAEPKVGACLEIAEWRGGNAALEQALFDAADCVTATGSDEALAAIRARLPLATRFVGHGHQVSFGYVANKALAGAGASQLAGRAADDIVAWNQLGCLSPHVIYIEHGAGVPAERFAETLAEELSHRERREPRGELPTELAAGIASRRAFYEVRAAHSPDTRMWRSENSTAWTVVYEADARFQVSCLNRFIYVKPVKNLAEALQNADAVRGKVSTVGLAAPEAESAVLTAQLARWGVTRVCPLGRMQDPLLTWRHDGRPTLGDLVTWTDWEME